MAVAAEPVSPLSPVSEENYDDHMMVEVGRSTKPEAPTSKEEDPLNCAKQAAAVNVEREMQQQQTQDTDGQQPEEEPSQRKCQESDEEAASHDDGARTLAGILHREGSFPAGRTLAEGANLKERPASASTSGTTTPSTGEVTAPSAEGCIL